MSIIEANLNLQWSLQDLAIKPLLDQEDWQNVTSKIVVHIFNQIIIFNGEDIADNLI